MNKITIGFFKSTMLTSIILMILGLLLIFESETTIVSISYLIGTVLITIGALTIINFIRKYQSNIKSSLDMIYGTVTIILGILIITNPHAIASIIPIIIGICIIINSASKLQSAMELKENNSKIWKTTLIISIISAICGVVLLFNPFKGAIIFTRIVGIFITIYAVLDIISSITIRKNVKDIQNVIEASIVEAEIIDDNSKNKRKKKNKTKKDK